MVNQPSRRGLTLAFGGRFHAALPGPTQQNLDLILRGGKTDIKDNFYWSLALLLDKVAANCTLNTPPLTLFLHKIYNTPATHLTLHAPLYIINITIYNTLISHLSPATQLSI